MIIFTFVCIIFNLLFILFFAYHHFWMVRMNQYKQIKETKIKIKAFIKKHCKKSKAKEAEPEKLAIEADGHNQ